MAVFDLSKSRHPEYPIEPIFRDRWSPRAMSGDPLERSELMSLFEAARWAPSSYNNQPWRFVYALRDSPGWDRLFSLLVEFNQSWASGAGALILVAAKQTFDNGKPSVTHALDAGAAWENFALQGTLNGLVVHGMEGFDYQRARTELGIPDDHDVLAMAAIGRPGRIEDLPGPLREREVPSDRKPLAEWVFEGRFGRPAE
ncbi:nitroreductase family protein [Thiohalomonas denitrificans]|uniref:nitroreductase family protein n=1 Tax=Thiohalomonas denitrificans TaxID=415747 RepID=UPI0026EA61A0|nr:nitroreductase family protein [Thiohalomonas denitrificans]